jgi:hypothetical protein
MGGLKLDVTHQILVALMMLIYWTQVQMLYRKTQKLCQSLETKLDQK